MKKYSRALAGIFVIVILITLLVCSGLCAANETLPTPEEIIAKNIEAIGGIKALKKVKNKKTVTIGKFVQQNVVIKYTNYRERPNYVCTLLDTGPREGSNGKMAWDIDGLGTRLYEGDELANALMRGLFDGIDGPGARYKSVKIESIEEINGKECYKVVKTPENGPERIVYYDKKSFMIVKTEYIHPNGNLRFETYIEKYQKINGILFPYKVVDFLNGQKNSEYTTEKIELNIEMPEGIFDMPEEVTAIMKQIKSGVWKKFDGTWKGTVPGPDGNPMDITYVFDPSEYNLKGSVSTKLGGGSFYGINVEGNKISFSVFRSGGIVHLTGTLSGDVINMIQKKGDDVKEFKLKRVKQGNEAG